MTIITYTHITMEQVKLEKVSKQSWVDSGFAGMNQQMWMQMLTAFEENVWDGDGNLDLDFKIIVNLNLSIPKKFEVKIFKRQNESRNLTAILLNFCLIFVT